jgi:hypothetical protein
MSEDETLYVLSKKEYNDFMTDILFRRRLASEILNYSLIVKVFDEWEAFYASLCEYIAILYRFEQVLEKVTLVGDWDEKNQRWFVDKLTAGTVAVFATSEISCRHELLVHNISFLLH